MNSSQTFLSRSLTIGFRGSLRIAFAVALLGFSAVAANSQSFWATWPFTAASYTKSFTLPDGTTGTVTKTETGCTHTPLPLAFQTTTYGLGYPSTYYTPTPPNSYLILHANHNRNGSLPGCDANAIVATYVLTFSETVANIRIHYLNLDATTFRFYDSSDNPINLVRLSGNNQFEVAGNAVNSTPAIPVNNGCESNAGANPSGGCGTIVVPGKYTELRYTATNLSDASLSEPQDTHRYTFSVASDNGDAPASYDNNGINEASHDLLATNLRFGASVDADSAEKSGTAASGDDATGSDDENGVAALDLYFPAGGQTCTGTLGTYTTLPLEYCAVVSTTNTGTTAGQVVGWIDANGDGDFTDAVDRSVPLNDPAVDDGSFATGNIPAGETRNVVLVWTGLPSTLPGNLYARFRVTRDATFFSSPQPTGAVIDGEVEDYTLLAPTAADVSVAGRVVTADGQGIRNARVTLTDMNGNSRTVATSSFGYYRFDEVEAGATYTVSVSSKSYQFEPRTVTVRDEIADLDFVALE